MKVLHWNLKNKRNVKRKTKKKSYPGGLEPPTFRLTAERANRLRHGDHLKSEGEILKFKSNDLFHYVIVPTSFPDPLFFTSSSFAVFSFIAELHRYIIFPYRIRENAKSAEGNLTGFDCYPGNGIHPNLDTECRIFFPYLLGNRDGSNVRCALQSKLHSSWLTFLEIKWREFIRYF